MLSATLLTKRRTGTVLTKGFLQHLFRFNAEAMPGYFLALPGLVDPTVAMALLLSKMGFFLNF